MDENKRKRVTVVVRRKPAANSRKVNEMISVMRNENRRGAKSDVLGSYTGTPIDDEVPVQDADDL